ncbi:hypothetical protein BDI4_910063 [Burkholderia diffusa]|uniref:hypothetical protein n=1 Tax=Burkholderia diffusa TaxID=488732 RepID=UPI001CB5A1E8|nr:hypothetical protein [Burkholderia diffusa]CAG9265736.1 hypothetical protein BDI4_910063 [Burkholderia diffusa]
MMKIAAPPTQYPMPRPLPTLGDQVRAEALRRGGASESQADDYARRAEAWFGRRPVRGEDLALVFEQVFRTG